MDSASIRFTDLHRSPGDNETQVEMPEELLSRVSVVPNLEDTEDKPVSLDWVGGFFDGEGSVSLNVRSFSIDIQVSITQVYRPILERVNSFLNAEGIFGGTVYSERGGRVNRLVFTSNHSILRMLTLIEPALRIKRRQARATIEYLSDALEGADYIEVMNQEVKLRRRGGKVRLISQHWVRSAGIKKTRLESMALARSVYQTMRHSE
jgi:hypothetical protein